jgi:CHASE2 domain-containing sensor protein/two-component sensor histidine kinase
MKRKIWQRIKAEIALWRIGAMPGIFVIGIVILVRLTGILQTLELASLDRFLHWRNAEPIDDRILIVGINEADIRQIGTYPIPDRELAVLIKELETYHPSVIGLDIYRDLPVEPGSKELVQVFQQYQNIIGVEKILSEASETVAPTHSLPTERVGFADQTLDPNGNLRRSLLSTSNPQGEFKLSLPILLAEKYLKTHGYSLENVPDDEWAMRFNSTELTRLQPNSGGYVQADTGGNQILFNFRSGQQPFRTVSWQQIKDRTVNPNWIRDRLVLIGITSTSVKDVINAPGIKTENAGLVYGVEINAHAVSQIISAVLDQRPLLTNLSATGEYSLIMVAGLFGLSLTRIFQSPWTIVISLGVAIAILIGVCYLCLAIAGLWLPVVPAFLVLSINGASLAASNFYRYQQNLKLQLQERQFIIDYTFDTIHNGPLQTLKQLLRETQQEDFQRDVVSQHLQRLDRELKTVYQSIKQETIVDENVIYIGDTRIDLRNPIKEILYQVYSSTIIRDFPCFQTLKYKIVKFEDLDSRQITIDQKRHLCRFLEEALCNVGKHAQGLTRLKVICTQTNKQNIIRIEDNGVKTLHSPDISSSKGRGTSQAINLAKQLNGKFKRDYKVPHGTVCELSWLSTPSRWS